MGKKKTLLIEDPTKAKSNQIMAELTFVVLKQGFFSYMTQEK